MSADRKALFQRAAPGDVLIRTLLFQAHVLRLPPFSLTSENPFLWHYLRPRLSHHRFPHQYRLAFPRSRPISPSPPKKIWKSLPLTRLSGADRTGVGHRRWVRKDTPALSSQPEQRLPSTLASVVPAFPNARPDLATRPASALPPAERRSRRRKQGGAGGIISPACLSCL